MSKMVCIYWFLYSLKFYIHIFVYIIHDYLLIGTVYSYVSEQHNPALFINKSMYGLLLAGFCIYINLLTTYSTNLYIESVEHRSKW